MRILFLSLFLFVGLNQILARSLPWNSRNSQEEHWWNDYEYDLFSLPSNNYDDDLHKFKFMADASSEESKDTIKSQKSHKNDEIDNFLGALVGSFLQDDSLITATSEETTDHNNQISFQIQTHSNERDHNDDGKTDNSNDDKKSNQFDILLYNPWTNIYETKEPKSSEEKKNDDKEGKKSSEENLFPIFTYDKSDEDSNEVAPSNNVELKMEIRDLTKSSEGKKDDNISENYIKELTTLLIGLGATEDELHILNNPVNIDKRKAIIYEIEAYYRDKRSRTTTSINDSDEITDSNYYTTITPKNNSNEDRTDDEDDKNDNNDIDSDENQEDESSYTTTSINDSDDIDDNNYHTTTSKNDSNEDDNDDSDDSDDKNDKNNNTDDTNASDSNENKLDLISVVLQGLDDADQQKNLNDHKYEVIELSQIFRPTTAPYMPELAASSSSYDHNAIQEYVEIREDLDTQQDSLQNNEIALDKDFYTILTNNYDKESISQFEKDIYVLQENLDRIKRNINAIQNIHSKLYFHKLITAAVEDVQNKSKE